MALPRPRRRAGPHRGTGIGAGASASAAALEPVGSCRHSGGTARWSATKEMGRLGTLMLPIKAIDTVQPLYGLTAFVLLIVFVVTGRLGILGPVALVVVGKLVIDVAFRVWSVQMYRRWVGDPPGKPRLGGGADSGRALHIPASAVRGCGTRLVRVPGRRAAVGPAAAVRSTGRRGTEEFVTAARQRKMVATIPAR